MHAANLAWWESVRAVYPHLFTGTRVLEVGSFDINGSVRQFFQGGTYVGVDWRQGPGVDVVSLAHEMVFDESFDVVVSASMLEHDPHWKQSLRVMAQHLVPTGALLLSWGGALSAPHEIDTAPDNAFHALPAGKVLRELTRIGVYVERFQYEAQVLAPARGTRHDGWDGVGLVGFLDKASGLGVRLVSELQPEDQA